MKLTSKMIVFAFATAMLGTAQVASAAPFSAAGGTSTIGSGGDYATLADYLDAACQVRELTGLISVAAASTTMTGVGTNFLTEVAVGDRILTSTGAFRGNAQILTVTAIASNTSLTVAAAPTAAITSLKATRQKSTFPTVLTGNVNAEIISNTTEPVNSMIILNTGGFSLTIKPAPSVTPTITFARAEDQQGFTGNLMIGTNNVGANAVLAATDNIIIDGSNTVAGTTRDLTFSTSAAYSSSVPIHVNGDADNVTIKNCIVNNFGTATGTNTSALRFTSVQYAAGATDFTGAGYAVAGTYTPDNWIVDNNELNVILAQQGHGVNSTTTGTIPAGTFQTNFQITNNDISASIRGIFLNNGLLGSTINNNRIFVPHAAGGNLDTWGIFLNNANGPTAGGTATISNNYIDVTNNSASTLGAHGIALLSAGAGLDRVYNVTNNVIVARHIGAGAQPAYNTNTAARAGAIRGFRGTSGVTYNLRQNSIRLEAAPALNANTPEFVFGVGPFTPTLTAAAFNAQNNQISVLEDGGTALLIPIANGTQTFASNDNNLFAGAGASVGSRGALFILPRGGTPSVTNTGQIESVGTTRTIRFGNTNTTTMPFAVGQTIRVDFDNAEADADEAAFEGLFEIASVTPGAAAAPWIVTYTAPTSYTKAASFVANGASRVWIVGSSAPTPGDEDYTGVTLANWQSVPGTFDAASSGVDPAGVVSTTDLHYITSPGANFTAAAQVGSITSDIDAQVRAATPNRGADEFTTNTAITAVVGTPVVGVAENAATALLVSNATGTDSNINDFPVVTATSSAGTVSVTRISSKAYRVNLGTALNFETTPSVDVTLTGTDRAGTTATQVYTIPVTNVNEAPTDITTAPVSLSVAENETTGTVVGALSTTDVDAGDSHVYSLVAGAGSTDNALFAISGGNLVTARPLDFEDDATTLTVRVQTQDLAGTGLTYAEAFQIILTNVTGEDSDADGIVDEVEGADASNAQAATFPSAVGAASLRLTTDAGSLALVTAAVSPGSEPANTVLPLGVVGFRITGLANGGSANVVLTYPTTAINGAFKTNGTVYTAIPGAVVTNTSISYTVTDGGALDADGVANGTIVDPVAPATIGTSTTDWLLLNN